MKHVFFKTVTIKHPTTGEQGEISYLKLIEGAINTPLNGKNFDFDENLKSLRLMAALEKGDQKGADFEDADFVFLCEKVKNLRFLFPHQAFEDFRQDVCTSKPINEKERHQSKAEA